MKDFKTDDLKNELVKVLNNANLSVMESSRVCKIMELLLRKRELNGPLSIANHSLFGEKRNNYADKFNRLADVLENANIEVELLREVIEAANELNYLGHTEAYNMGIRDAELLRTLEDINIIGTDLPPLIKGFAYSDNNTIVINNKHLKEN